MSLSLKGVPLTLEVLENVLLALFFSSIQIQLQMFGDLFPSTIYLKLKCKSYTLYHILIYLELHILQSILREKGQPMSPKQFFSLLVVTRIEHYPSPDHLHE